MRTFLCLLLCLALAACAAHREPEPGTPGSPWPAALDPGRMHHDFRFMASDRQARQAIWDSRNAFTLFGGSLVDLDVSQARLRLQAQVRSTRSKAVYPPGVQFRRGCLNPSSVTCDAYPDFVDQVSVERKTEIIPLNAIAAITLQAPATVRVLHEKSRLTELVARDPEVAGLLADALATLARPYGYTPPVDPGLSLADLTWTQRSRLGLSSGVLVTGVETNGPAERAGLRHLDVILTADGHSLDAAALLARIKALDLPGSAPIRLEVLHWRLDKDDPLDKTGPFSTELRPRRDL
jgi:hypothetical protein